MENQFVFQNSVLKSALAENKIVVQNEITLTSKQNKVTLLFDPSMVYLLSQINQETYMISNEGGSASLIGIRQGWILPKEADQYKEPIEIKEAIEIKTEGRILVQSEPGSVTVDIEAAECRLIRHSASPRADFLGNTYEFSIEGGAQLEKTLAEFYWKTLLPSVIEQTRAKEYPMWRGYVVSTLQPGEYAGTYPDVDHEFQCKGRIAMAGCFDLEVVKRMLELQFQVMREDPAGLWRNPCAIQPDGVREYHVRRNSADGKTNAEMFLITGNVECIEAAWLYVAASKDFSWLSDHMEELEGAASLIEYLTDSKGRLWSDVFYEDQVIKDGMECMSAAMAANAFSKLATLEELLGRKEKQEYYKKQESILAKAMVQQTPTGFWDQKLGRFVDWIDRNGQIHDHIHLLANSLPVLFSYASKEQAEQVDRLIQKELAQFQRFPAFLSPRIQDYTESEIGDGGPYDLCAAGRYWCWDAAYWAAKGDCGRLLEQLLQVAAQAELDKYRMGERYDMNHIYYQSEKNWHGAPYYYEYPCVFTWVLIHDYLGIAHDLVADFYITPRLNGYGRVKLDSYGIEYAYSEEGFHLWNHGNKKRRFRICLASLNNGSSQNEYFKEIHTITLQPGAVWKAKK